MSEHYMIAAYGDGGYITIPCSFFIEFPAGRFVSAKNAADALFTPDWTGFAPDQDLTPTDFDSAYPLRLYGLPMQPFPGVDRYDVTACRMRDDVRAELEIMPKGVRVYLHPAKRASHDRSDLEDQSIQGLDVLDAIRRIVEGR